MLLLGVAGVLLGSAVGYFLVIGKRQHDRCTVNASCPCLNVKCERHGRCCECINFHRSKKGIVFCMHLEKDLKSQEK